MARQVRNRVTAIVFGGFLLGAAVATTGTANAGQVATGGRQVVFGGGSMLGISCRSTPSIESMIVPAESTVRLVNRTGRGAKLLLNGNTKGTVADDAVTEVVFRRGTTAVTLDPECAITDQAMPVLVTATPTTTPSPGETLTPPKTPDGQTSVDPSGTTQPSTPGGNSGTPPTDPTATQPPATSAGPGSLSPRPTTDRPVTQDTGGVAESPAPLVPLGRTPKIKDKDLVGTTGADGPLLSGMPPGDEQMVLDGVPEMALPSDPAVPAPSLDAAPVSPVAEAGAVVAMEPISTARPIGLLALVAMVCVLGVGTGAIRAFVSERASRASLA